MNVNASKEEAEKNSEKLGFQFCLLSARANQETIITMIIDQDHHHDHNYPHRDHQHNPPPYHHKTKAARLLQVLRGRASVCHGPSAKYHHQHHRHHHFHD